MWKYPVHFAPLQGYTDAPYRNAHHKLFGGIEAYYSPFIRLEGGEVRRKDIRDISSESNTCGLLIPQVIAGTPDELNTILAAISGFSYKEICLNMGCPFPMYAKREKGSGILPHPDKVKELLDVVADYSEINFSVKMRLGHNNPDESTALLSILNKTRLCRIILHPRIGLQQYKGDVNLDAFNNFYNKCNLPLIYNGDIATIKDALSITEKFPNIQGLMIGRGLLARPSLAHELTNELNWTENELKYKIRQMHSELFAHYQSTLQGDTQILFKMRSFWEYLQPIMERKIFKGIKKSRNIDQYKNIVSQF